MTHRRDCDFHIYLSLHSSFIISNVIFIVYTSVFYHSEFKCPVADFQYLIVASLSTLCYVPSGLSFYLPVRMGEILPTNRQKRFRDPGKLSLPEFTSKSSGIFSRIYSTNGGPVHATMSRDSNVLQVVKIESEGQIAPRSG